MNVRRAASLVIALGVRVSTAAPLPITGGGSSSNDEAVVALAFTGDALECTGTVIAPHAVLTAAHCIGENALPSIAIGDDLITATRHKILAAFVHPQFNSQTLDHDIAVVIVEPDLGPTPIPIASSLGNLGPGSTFRIVGYGWTVANDTTPALRRTGTSQLDEIQDLRLVSHGAPNQVCEGDSGGPALYDDGGGERVIGVTSSGDTQCAQFGKHTRVDIHAGFIDNIVSSTARGAAKPGDRCWYQANCAVGPCLPAFDDPRLSFCSPECDNGTCPGDLECRTTDGNEYCRHSLPSPGAEGSPCENDTECASQLCVAASGESRRVCATRCFSDLPGFDCPTGETCGAAADGGEACFGPPPEDGCGCKSSRDTGALLVLVALGLCSQGLRGRGRP